MTEMGIGGFTSLLDDSFIFNKLTEKEYPDFVTRTIRILGANSGLRLIFANKLIESKFDSKGKIIFIPPPPFFPKKGNKKVMEAFFQDLSEWRGVLNHEVGHARFTLWRARKHGNRELGNYCKKYHEFVDLFENGRMERVVCEEYPGMLPDLQSLEGVLHRTILEFQKKNPKNFKHLYYAMRMAVSGYPIATEIPKKLQKDLEKCMEFVQAAQETNSEEETVEIAKEVYKYFKKREKEEKKKEKANTEEGGDNEKEEDSKESNEEEREKDDSSGDKGESTEDEQEELEEGEERGRDREEDEDDDIGHDGRESDGDDKENRERSEDSEDDNIDSSDSGSDNDDGGDDDNSESKNENSEDGSSGSTEGDDEDDFEGKSVCFSTEGIEIIDPLKTFVFEQELADECNLEDFYIKMPRGCGDVIPMPLDDYVDSIEIKPTKNTHETNEILGETIGSICGMAQRFIQKVRSTRHVGRRTYQGRLSSKSLHKFRTSKNIFKTENMRKKKGASVMIIVDCSGSMGGSKIETALAAALVMGEIMHQAKVEFEVVGFTVSNKIADFKAFTRTKYLQHYRFGSSKNWNSCKYGLINAGDHLRMLDNDDGESLRQFASEIAKSKKERKMMIVISDGQPVSSGQRGDTNKDLHRAIKEIRESGTDIYAIGLGMAVEKFYGEKNSINISVRCSTEDLVLAMSKFINLIETY